MARAFASRDTDILNDWSHEGPDDPAGDEELAEEALAEWEAYKDKREMWMTLVEFEAELKRAAAA